MAPRAKKSGPVAVTETPAAKVCLVESSTLEQPLILVAAKKACSGVQGQAKGNSTITEARCNAFNPEPAAEEAIKYCAR